MTNSATQARPAGRSGTPRPKGRPGRKPKGSMPVVVPETPGKPDPGHDEDMGTLNSRRAEAGEAANAALGGELSSEQAHQVRELLEICERVLRRRRILAG